MDEQFITESFVSKFDIKGKPVYAKILWKNTKDILFKIQIFVEEQSWSGELSCEMSRAFKESFDENDEQYSMNVKDALKQNNSMYTYDISPIKDDGNIKFYWKKTFVNSSATMVHGFVSLRKDETTSKNDIIDFLLEINKNLSLTIEDFKNKNQILECDILEWKNEFQNFVDLKTSLESTLYGKFVQLLNTKKRRIQDLENHLNDL